MALSLPAFFVSDVSTLVPGCKASGSIARIGLFLSVEFIS